MYAQECLSLNGIPNKSKNFKMMILVTGTLRNSLKTKPKIWKLLVHRKWKLMTYTVSTCKQLHFWSIYSLCSKLVWILTVSRFACQAVFAVADFHFQTFCFILTCFESIRKEREKAGGEKKLVWYQIPHPPTFSSTWGHRQRP